MPRSESAQAGPRERLESWKSIAAYLQRDVRTVQRWEKTESLPVRRVKHEARSTVFAWTDELDEWVLSRSGSPPAAAPRLPIRLAAVLAAVVLLGFVLWGVVRGPPAPLETRVLPHPLTAETGVNWGPRFSPDGSRVAYTRQLGAKQPANVVIRDVSGGGEVVVNPTPLPEYSPAWSPSGAELAFLRRVGKTANDLVIASLPGFKEKKLTQIQTPNFADGGNLGDDWLDWSPDGRFIVAPVHEGPDAPFRIALIDTQTGRRRFLTELPQNPPGDTNARFSTDGSRLAVLRRSGTPKSELLLIELDRDFRPGKVSRYTHVLPSGSAARILGAAWTPDGERILFSAEEDGGVTRRLWSVSAAGLSGVYPIPTPNLRVSSLDIVESPDGRWPLAYVNTALDIDIWKIPLSETEEGPAAASRDQWTKIADSLADDNRAVVSPDGRSLAFTSDRTGSPQIWTVELSSGKLQQLTNFPPTRLGHKSWSPDGREIVFIRFGPQGRDLDSVRVSDKRIVTLADHPDHEGGQYYSADGRFLYYIRGYDSYSLPLRLPLEGGEPEEFLGRNSKAVLDDPRGGWIYEWDHKLWSLAGPRAKPVVLIDRPSWDPTSSAITGKGAYRLTNDNHLIFYSFADKKLRTLVRFNELVRAGVSVSPNDDAVFITLLEHQMQIMTLEDIRASH